QVGIFALVGRQPEVALDAIAIQFHGFLRSLDRGFIDLLAFGLVGLAVGQMVLVHGDSIDGLVIPRFFGALFLGDRQGLLEIVGIVAAGEQAGRFGQRRLLTSERKNR